MIIERFRTHPHLIEVRQAAPTTERLRFRAIFGEKEFSFGEMPCGRSSFLLNLGTLAAECTGLKWQACGRALAPPVWFVDSDRLQPGFTDGTRVRVYWQARDFQTLRVCGIRWVEGEAGPTSVSLPEMPSLTATDREWVVPNEWLGPDPVELRLTPFIGERQGLTECLLLPPRKLRIETVFQRVMLPLRGGMWRRLRVVVRVPPPLTPPSAFQIDWQPYDEGVEPVSHHLEWDAGSPSAELALENISLRGDRVRVHFNMPPGCNHEFAYFVTDETGYGAKLPDGMLGAGCGEEYHQFEYVHKNALPNGSPATILSNAEPLPMIPGLGGESEHELADAWPTTLLESYREVAATETWAELRQTFLATTATEEEFARIPQLYLQYIAEPDLRAIARRCGAGPAPFIVDQLLRSGHEAGPADQEALDRFLKSATDPELNRWLEAVAAGASVDRLGPFWYRRGWKNPPSDVLWASCQLEQVAAEPLDALTPELVRDTVMSAELTRAVKAEAVLLTASAMLADFARASFLRKAILSALSAYWRDVLSVTAESRWAHITELLATRPQSAARELAALRGSANLPDLQRGRWPVFVAEAVVAVRVQTDRDIQLRIAADWCRTLLERRILPRWPWFGLLPEGQTTGDILALWEAVRLQLPTASTVASCPQPEFRLAIQEFVELSEELRDPVLQSIAGSFRENCAPLSVWIG